MGASSLDTRSILPVIISIIATLPLTLNLRIIQTLKFGLLRHCASLLFSAVAWLNSSNRQPASEDTVTFISQVGKSPLQGVLSPQILVACSWRTCPNPSAILLSLTFRHVTCITNRPTRSCTRLTRRSHPITRQSTSFSKLHLWVAVLPLILIRLSADVSITIQLVL